MKMTYEKSTDSAYILLNKSKEAKVKKTIDLNNDMSFNIDIDESGNVIGIEILDFESTYGYYPESIKVENLDKNKNLEVYTPEEVASILKINSDTVRKYIRAGKISASKIGNNYRLTSKNIEDFLNKNLVSL